MACIPSAHEIICNRQSEFTTAMCTHNQLYVIGNQNLRQLCALTSISDAMNFESRCPNI